MNTNRKECKKTATRSSQIPRRWQLPRLVYVDVPLFVIVDLFNSKPLPHHAQKVCIPLVADLTGQQHHRGVRTQVLQSLQQGHESVFQVHNVCSKHQIKAASWVAFKALTPGQLGHNHWPLGVWGHVCLHIFRQEVQCRFPVSDGHFGT